MALEGRKSDSRETMLALWGVLQLRRGHRLVDRHSHFASRRGRDAGAFLLSSSWTRCPGLRAFAIVSLADMILSLRLRSHHRRQDSNNIFSHSTHRSEMVRAFWARSAKSSLYIAAAIVSVAMARHDCGFGCLVQDVVCFKRDNSTACNYVLRANRHCCFRKTLKRHWHAGCLKM